MNFSIKQIIFKFIFIVLTLFLSLSSYAALTPGLLTQLRTENIIDTTGTLSKQEIQQLQLQNQKIRNEAHVSINILVLDQLPDTKENPFLLDVILDQTKSLTPNVEDQVALLIGIKNKNYLIQASDENKKFTNTYYGSGIETPYNNKLSSIEHIILKPLLEKNKFYPALQNAQNYIQQIALHQEPTAEKQYYEEVLKTERQFKNYIIFTVWMLVFGFFCTLLARLLTTQFNLKNIKIISASYIVIHSIFSIYFAQLNFGVDTFYLSIISSMILFFYYFFLYKTSNFQINPFNNIPYIIDIFVLFFIFTLISLLFKSHQPRIVLVTFLFMLIGAYAYNRIMYSLFRFIFRHRMINT